MLSRQRASVAIRWAWRYLLVVLLVAVLGLSPIASAESRLNHTGKEEQAPVGGSESSRCALPPKVVGVCRAHLYRWSYVKSSGKCEKFVYGGCGGKYGNNFSSPSDCERICLGKSQAESTSTEAPKPSNDEAVSSREGTNTQVNCYAAPPTGRDKNAHKKEEPEEEFDCKAPKKIDTCGHVMLPIRVYFDATTRKCRRVPRRSCAYGKNSFRGITDCQRACLSRKQVCELPPKATGRDCKAKIPMWSFVKSTGKCEQFDYSGCGRNANSFYTYSRCAKFCVNSKKRQTSSS